MNYSVKHQNSGDQQKWWKTWEIKTEHITNKLIYLLCLILVFLKLFTDDWYLKFKKIISLWYSNVKNGHSNKSWGNTRPMPHHFSAESQYFLQNRNQFSHPPPPIPFDVWVSGSYIRHRGQKPEKASQFTGRLQRNSLLLHRWSWESRVHQANMNGTDSRDKAASLSGL